MHQASTFQFFSLALNSRRNHISVKLRNYSRVQNQQLPNKDWLTLEVIQSIRFNQFQEKDPFERSIKWN